MTEIPHPSNVTDQDNQRTHYIRLIAEQLARIGDVLEGSPTPTKVPQRANMTDREQLQTYNLRQVAVQLARTADALEAEAAQKAKPAPTRRSRAAAAKAASN